ncbi:MAG: hypothetical protein DDT19_00015 [Syntrophomonadaceae bacterium]|nr:hypothetical protein [Bacillota bacterium]
MEKEDIKRVKDAQDLVLTAIRPLIPPEMALTGGTALTRFHGFRHRFSEDLDFFGYRLSKEKVMQCLRGLFNQGFSVELLSMDEGNDEKKKTVYHSCHLITPHDKSFIGMEIGHTPIRVDFVEDVFSGCWLHQNMKTVDTKVKFPVDSLEAILHKKLYAIYNKKMCGKEPRTKDILDIHALFINSFVKKRVSEFYKNAREIVMPFDSIMKIMSEAKLDFSEVKGLDVKFREYVENLGDAKQCREHNL